MFSYSIMPLFPERREELCADILRQQAERVSDMALFMAKLVPEGNPPIPKAELFADEYIPFRDALQKAGGRCGILAQCTIGHGYKLDEPSAFQNYVGLTEDDTDVTCPYDAGFRDYLRHAFAVLAELQPEMLMVDDDFSLVTRPGFGCWCPLHQAEFQKRAGFLPDAKTLFHMLRHRRDSAENERIAEIYEETQRESLLGAARAIREGIDSVNPSVQGSLCTVGIEPAGEAARLLAGEGNPSVIRINNSSYTPTGTHELAYKVMCRAATQMRVETNRADVYLAETDTCPQNRYSVSAQQLHAHYTASLLEGVSGAVHWITRMNAGEKNSGRAYRDKLGANAGFYEAIEKLAPTLRWQGCRVPMPKVVHFDYEHLWEPALTCNGWYAHVLSRLGLPFYFSEKAGGVVIMDDPTPDDFSDDEIADMLRDKVILSGMAAKKLYDRGLEALLGVSVRPWKGQRVSGELVEGNVCQTQVGCMELRMTAPGAKAESMCFHLEGGKERIPLFPGCVSYENAQGGTVITFCGTPWTEFTYYSAFSFLNESRKAQLIRLLGQCEAVPVYYPDDGEVLLRTADMEDGSQFCAVFNMGFDPIFRLPLCVRELPQTAEKLLPDGTWQRIGFTAEGERITLDTPAWTLEPVILKLR